MIGASNPLIAQREFTIDASQQRVWELLPRAIYQGLPLEKIDIVNERNFNAELRWNLIFIGLKFHLKGEFIEIIPPSFFGCILFVKKGIFQLGLKVTFELRSVNQKRTQIICEAMERKKRRGALLKWAMRIPEERLCGNAFQLIRARLEQIA